MTLALASVMIFMFSACSSDDPTDDTDTTYKLMKKSDVKDFDKYYKSAGYSGEDMLRSDAKWSWWRSKQSDHFFVFWESGFGEDPNSSSLREEMRVDVDDLLLKAEQFYQTNVEKLKMVNVGQGKSQLDKYKMNIYLFYQTEWLATGSGYDDVIGALWVNPTTCQPVGATIAHEIGHSFQYQVYCDQLLNKEAKEIYSGSTWYEDGCKYAFRYGYGKAGTDGCTYWEQCAQWQSFQDYPEEAFTQDGGYHIATWLSNHHRHFYNEWQRYASYWWQYYLTQKHGIEAFGNIWKESLFPEDPLETAARLYCGGDMEKFYDEYYDYASRCVAYDFDAVHQYATDDAMNYTATMLHNTDGSFQPAYSNCPETTGFNVIPLDVPAAGTTVTADLKAIAPGSALNSKDGGQIVDGDGNAKGTTTTYNQQSNTSSCYRIGFVSVDGSNKAKYGTMAKGKDATASFTVPSDAQKLYLVVVATPTTYNHHTWNDDETDDEQWPYAVTFGNTTLKGYIDIDPNKTPEDVTIKHTLKCNAASTDYVQGTIDLYSTGDLRTICQAFGLSSADLASATTSNAKPAEGKVAFCLLQPDGSLIHNFTATAGFYCKADGYAGSWGNDDPVYFEYDPTTFVLTYGHNPGHSVSGTTYTVKPCLVYTKDGKQYKATIELTMKF